MTTNGDAVIVFAASPLGPQTQLSTAVGERLMDACDTADAAVPFSCRAATCGTCLVEVASGADLLDEVGIEEGVVLDALGRPPTNATDSAGDVGAPRYRLACQAVVSAPGFIAVRLAHPAPKSGY